MDEEEIKSLNIFLVSLISLVVLWIVWKSSEIREIPTNFETINIGVRRSASIISQASTASTSTVEDNLTSSVEDIAENIIFDASESYNSNVSPNSFRNILDDEDQLLSDEERIIREMDRDLPSQSNSSTNARRRNLNLSTTRDEEDSSQSVVNTASPNEGIAEITSSETKSQDDEKEKISIKLKFLNDEIKIDNHAHLNETVLSFKKRNFKTELESKLIKLIFNGKLLEDDKKTLNQCGIFSEAVVHCLVIQKKSSPVTNNAPVSNQNQSARRRNNNGAYFTNVVPIEWNGTLMVYIFGMALASITLIFCWFARIQYEIYFSFYSTVGLILITTLFIVLIPLFSMVFS